MTLHLTKIGRAYTLQVSDRLVTSNSSVFDPESNKNVIYLARDGIVSLAYTGNAFIDGIHTDDWIVEKLSGNNLAEFDNSFIFGWRIEKWLNLGQSVEVLRTELDSAFAKMTSSHRRLPFQLIIAGWHLKWINKRMFKRIPFTVFLYKGADQNKFQKILPQRYWYYYVEERLYYVPNGHINLEDRKQIRQSIEKTSGFAQVNADESESILVDAIHRVADRVPTVGKNCMSILMPPPPLAPIRVKYIPANFDDSNDSPIAYSPWLVSPTHGWKPSEMNATLNTHIGPFQVQLISPQAKFSKSNPFYTKSQVRRKVR